MHIGGMNLRSHIAMALLATFLLQGCFSSVVRATGPAGSEHSSAGASLFWGITTPTHGATQCANGLREVEMYRPWYSYLVAVVTLGIVTPITSRWECMGAPAGYPAQVGVPVHPAAPVAPTP